jgi:hypothetical protein
VAGENSMGLWWKIVSFLYRHPDVPFKGINAFLIKRKLTNLLN